MATLALPQFDALALDAAGGHLARNVPVAAPSEQAGDVRRALEGRRYDSATELAVCDDGSLVGVLKIEDLLAAPAAATVADLMDADPPVVTPGVDQEVAAWKAVQQGESALAVVDADRRLLGFIPPHRLLAVLLWEHEEDMSRLGGFLRDTQSARTASEEPVLRRFLHRLPWLLIGLVGAIAAAYVVSAFETQLAEHVVLAFFVPGIVYLADAVGTQTEALVIRGLSVGVGIGRVVWRELLTGLSVGLALSLAFFPVAVWRWGETDVALAVSLSLLAASATATLVAMALPAVFHRFGADPAFGSGPLATVIQDLLSILIYLSLASALV